jgi:hypothetical protein
VIAKKTLPDKIGIKIVSKVGVTLHIQTFTNYISVIHLPGGSPTFSW